MNEIQKTSDQEPNLPALPDQTLPAIDQLTKALGIPREVLASDEEIQYAWRDLPRELRNIPVENRDELIARMCVAVSTGLFDGAINYIWNAAILKLRDKIRNFGLPVVAQINQSDFEERELLELQDSRLIELCHKLNLIDEDGFFFLDQCREIRNNFSAAHPTIGNLNDREFILFVNRCVKYAMDDSSSPKGVDIEAFITALNGSKFSGAQKEVWAERVLETHEAQRELLIGMVHGIYCDPDKGEEARLNCIDICESLKNNFTNSIRSNLITRHSEYLASGDNKRHTTSQKFFEKLGLLSLLNESEQHLIFKKAIDRLLNAHLGGNNFYNEPPFAERLLELSQQGKVPETIQEEFVNVVVGSYMGNRYGVSWEAEHYYVKMIKGFSPREIYHMVKLPTKKSLINRKLKVKKCRNRFGEVLNNFIDVGSVHSRVQADFEALVKKYS